MELSDCRETIGTISPVAVLLRDRRILEGLSLDNGLVVRPFVDEFLCFSIEVPEMAANIFDSFELLGGSLLLLLWLDALEARDVASGVYRMRCQYRRILLEGGLP